MFRTLLVTGLFSGICSPATLWAADATLESLRVSGDCSPSDLRIIKEHGRYSIAAFFDSFAVQSHSTQTFDRRRCTLNYDVKMAAGRKFSRLRFSVNGFFQLSEEGTARLTVSHRAANGPTIRMTELYPNDPNGPRVGPIKNFLGEIVVAEMKDEYQNCGAKIPMETTLFLQAVQPSTDISGYSSLVLEGGASYGHTKLARTKTSSCTDQ